MTHTVTIPEDEYIELILGTKTDEQLVDMCSDAFKAKLIRGACVADLVQELTGKKPVAAKPKKARQPNAAKATLTPTVSPKTLDVVRDAVSDGCRTRNEIKLKTQLSLGSISKALDQGVAEGWITQTGKRDAKFTIVATNGAAEAMA